METIEFLQTTEQKSIKSFIGIKVKEKLLDYERTIAERQRMLRDILESEIMQYNEELVQLMNEKLNEQTKKRLDWIKAETMELIKAEEELLKLKNQQRELANCEEWRHFQSKQLLLDSKKGQLYQIEDKKLRTQKEKQIDRIWHDAMKRLNDEKEYQEIYKNKLLKVIEGTNQLKNQEIHENNKHQLELEYEQSKKEIQDENKRSLLIEEKYRRDANRKESLNKMIHSQMLKSQIALNLEKKMLETQLLSEEARLQKEVADRKLFSQQERTVKQKILNNQQQKYYLENFLKEKQQKLQKESEFYEMYLNTGCVLQQKSKNPYGKNTR